MGHRYIVVYSVVAVGLYVAAMSAFVVLMREYRKVDGWELASSYSSMFLFPATFLPLILIFLYIPIRDYVRFTIDHWEDSKSKQRRWWLLFPILLALIVSLAATAFEITQNSIAVWEVARDQDGPNGFKGTAHQSIRDAGTGQAGSLRLYYQLRAADEVYRNLPKGNDRNDLNRLINDGKREYGAFFTLEKLASKQLAGSNTRPYYIASFFITFIVISTTLVLIIFYSSLHMAVGSERVRFRGTCLGLTAVTLCFLAWIPMRTATFMVKKMLYPTELINPAGDVLIALMFILAAVAISMSWLREHKETFTGAVTIASAIASAFSVYWAPDFLLLIFATPAFYFCFVILALVPLTGILLYRKFKELV